MTTKKRSYSTAQSASLLEHRAGYQTLTLYEDLIAITKNNHCKATLLAYIEQCLSSVLETDEQDFYVCIRLQDFEQALFGLYNGKTISITLIEMEREGFIERRQSQNMTRAFEYRLNLSLINSLLHHLPEKPKSHTARHLIKKSFSLDPNKIVSPAALRAQYLLLEQFQGKCAYCQRAEATTWDHIIPQSLDGLTLLKNLVPACASCNSSKGNRNVFTWMRSQGIQPDPKLQEAIEQAYMSLDEERNGGER